MGPQLYRCGNIASLPLYREPRECFNGAATLSLRKLNLGRNGIFAVAELQWGRNFIVAETTRNSAMAVAGVVASMGPQLYRCGNVIPMTEYYDRNKRFNGAATLSLRKHAEGVLLGKRYDELQWGRNFIVAETSLRCSDQLPSLSLQWGRNFIVAETWCPCRKEVRA